VTLEEFVAQVVGFDKLGATDQIRAFIWYLHVHRNSERLSSKAVGDCFEELHMHKPTNLSQLIANLVGRDLIKDTAGLVRLAKTARDKLDSQYADRAETAMVDKLLSDLPGKLSSVDQQDYLNEALVCFRYKAFRAAAVMTWNVVYDHLVTVIVGKHLAAFNTQLAINFTGKKKAVATRDDFQKLKESDVIDVCNAGALVSKEVAKVLTDKLDKRNSAAHPSGSKLDKLQAEAFISDLVNNAMLKIH